jgi:hypothetical protein
MEDIQRKTEKILGSKNYKNNRDKELRGESPVRKVTMTSKTTTRMHSRSSLGPTQQQAVNTAMYKLDHLQFQNANSYSKYRTSYQPSPVCLFLIVILGYLCAGKSD